MPDQPTKRERVTAKKRQQQEARMRAAKARQKRRLITVLATLGAIVAGIIYLMSRDSGSNTLAGASCPDREAATTVDRTYDTPPAMQIDPAKNYSATIETSEGDIVVDLLPAVAPKTVNNFVALSCDGFYDGLTFHRVIPDFMIQGGDPLGTGSGDPGYKFEDEFDPATTFDQKGLLAMANSGANTNGSQFFITDSTPTHLNQKHTIFGRVTTGQDVVTAIASVPKGAGDKPITPVTITRILITES